MCRRYDGAGIPRREFRVIWCDATIERVRRPNLRDEFYPVDEYREKFLFRLPAMTDIRTIERGAGQARGLFARSSSLPSNTIEVRLLLNDVVKAE